MLGIHTSISILNRSVVMYDDFTLILGRSIKLMKYDMQDLNISCWLPSVKLITSTFLLVINLTLAQFTTYTMLVQK